VADVRGAKRFVREAVVRHQQKARGGRGNARQSSGEQATSAPISISNPNTGTRATRASTCMGAWLVPKSARQCESRALPYMPNGEEDSRDNRALDHGARNCFKRIARSAPSVVALSIPTNEKRKHKAEPQSAARHAAKVQLLSVQMKTVARQHQQHHSEDHNKRCRFDPGITALKFSHRGTQST